MNRAVEKSIREYFGKQKLARESEIGRMIDFYENNHIPYVKDHLKLGKKTSDNFPYSYVPLTRHILKKKSLVYKNAPVRNTDNEKYEKLTKKKDKWMKEAERQA